MFNAMQASAYEICANASECLRLGRSAVEADQSEKALDYLVASADLASGAYDRSTLLSAFVLLTNANLKMNRPLVAHAWAQAALEYFEGSGTPQEATSALDNLARVKSVLPPLDGNRGVAGTYQGYAGHGYWSEMKVARREDGEILMDWSLIRFGTVPSAYDYGPAAVWDMSATGTYDGGDLIITYEGLDGGNCTITFGVSVLSLTFLAPSPEEFSQACRTGGANVLPWGPFWLVDATAPQIEDSNE